MSKLISPEEYKRLHPDSKVGVETIKRMIKSGEMKGIVSQNGDKLPRYYVEIDENEESGYSKEYVLGLQRTIAAYEEKFKTISQISKI